MSYIAHRIFSWFYLFCVVLVVAAAGWIGGSAYAYYEIGGTQISYCPIDPAVALNTGATAAQLADWYRPPDGDYAGYRCPTSDTSQCPGGIAWREGQCTYNHMKPTQRVVDACIEKVRLYKLSLIVQRGHCVVPAVWTGTVDQDTGVVTPPVLEQPQPQPKNVTNTIPLVTEELEKEIMHAAPQEEDMLALVSQDFAKQISNSWNQIDWEKVNQELQELQQNSGDPVDLSRGAMVWSNVLMDEQTKGMDFVFRITHDNQSYYDGVVGRNWNHNWNKFITIDDKKVTYYNGMTRSYAFGKQGDKRTNASRMELTQEGHEYVLRLVGTDTMMRFAEQHTDNPLWRIVSYSRDGVTYTLQYDDDAYLQSITDPQGREITFVYDEFNPAYPEKRLTSVSHPHGRRVTFDYYTAASKDDDASAGGLLGDLKSATVSHGGEERVITFTYVNDVRYVEMDDGADRVVNNTTSHNLATVDDALNQIYVKNEYDDQDRVIAQIYGDKTLRYSYTETTDGGLSVDITDRRGQTATQVYDDQYHLLSLTDESGVTYTYTYDTPDQQVSQTTYPDGSTVAYSYNAAGDATKVIYSYNGKQTTQTMTYNDRHLMTQKIDQHGITHRYVYDDSARITRYTQRAVGGGAERVWTFAYTPSGQVGRATLPDGQSISYTYDDADNMTQMVRTGSDGKTITTAATYDSTGNLLTVTDGNGNTTSLTHDTWDRTTKAITPMGIVTTYAYDANDNVTQTVRDADGVAAKTTMTYDLLDNPTAIKSAQDADTIATTAMSYDPNENVSTTTLPSGLTWSYEYDSLQRLTAKTATVNGQKIRYGYTYDKAGRVTSTTDPNGNTTTYTYGIYGMIGLTTPRGTSLRRTYDDRGNVTAQTVTAKDGTTVLASTTYTYDARNQPLSTTRHDKKNNKTIVSTVVYDAYGRIVTRVAPHGGETRYTYDGFGRVASVKDPLTNITTYTYDNNSNLTKETLTPATPEIGPKRTRYTYDKDNRRVGTENNIGQKTAYTYNNLNQLITQTDPQGVVTLYVYDYHGNLIRQTQHDGSQEIITRYLYDTSDRRTKQVDANGNETSYAYDTLGRLTRITYADGASATYQYDPNGNVTSITDANGNTITNTYNKHDRLTRRAITHGEKTAGVTLEEYLYDELGRVTKIDNDEHTTSTFDYDMLGNLTSERNNGQDIYYRYDDANRLSSLTYPSKSTIDYQYDIANRITAIHHNKTRIWHATTNSLYATHIRRANDTVTDYTYDDIGRLGSLKHTAFAHPDRKALNQDITATYSYDLRNNLLSNGEDNYTYDDISQLKTAKYKINKIAAWDKTALSQVYTYDKLGNRTADTNDAFAASINHFFHQIGLGYSSTRSSYYGRPNGYWTTFRHHRGGIGDKAVFDTTNASYQTNNRNQYTTAQVNMTGSITDQVACWFGSPNCRQEIDRSHQFGYTYDPNGNMTRDNTRTYTYDYRNRLVSAERTNISKDDNQIYKVTYRYDNFDRRVKKEVYTSGWKRDVVTTTYTYAGQEMVREEVSYSKRPDRNHEKEYVYNIQQTDDVIYSTLRKLSWTLLDHVQEFYYHKDHQGSVVAVSDTNGDIVQKYTYDAWGNVIATETNHWYDIQLPWVKAGLQNYRLYTSREYEPELGLYYYRARYYSPVLGRFISQDPLLYIDGPNPYSYVTNNPLNFVDPWGLEKSIVGQVRLYVYPGSRKSILDGHAWIEIHYNNGLKESYGIGQGWGEEGSNSEAYILVEGSNIVKNYESSMSFATNSSNVIYVYEEVKQSQIDKIHSIVRDMANQGRKRSLNGPCTDFATDVWRKAGFNDITDRNWHRASNPDTLYLSIYKLYVIQQGFCPVWEN